MVLFGNDHKDESLFLKSPRELFLLFAGGEVTTSKPKPNPIPEIPKETVPLAVKSLSQTSTVVTNHPSVLDKLKHFGGSLGLNGGASSKASDLVLYKAKVTILRANVPGIDVGNPVSDFVALGQEVINNHVTFQLVSNEVDPVTKWGKLSGALIVEHWGEPRDLLIPTPFEYKLDFYVAKDFGVPRAIVVNNGHKNLVLAISKITISTEFKLTEASITLPNKSVVTFACNSWIYALELKRKGRVLFANKEYTPADTPTGLVQLRENELKDLQGDGTGERKEGDRIYNYVVYNDLETPENVRPILGGSCRYPYPC